MVFNYEMNSYLIKQFVIAGCLYIGQMMSGYTMGWSAPMLPKLQDPEQTPFDNILTDTQGSWIASAMAIGTISGPYLSGYLSNVIGRKPCLYLGGCLTVLGYLILSLAGQASILFISRIVIGFGVGIIFVTNVVYLGEIASTNIRGMLLTLLGMFTALGTLLVYSVGPFVSYWATGWIGIAVNGCNLIGLYFLVPESPIYLVLAGKREEAAAVLESLGRKDDINDVLATATEKPESKITQLVEMFTVKSNRKTLFIIIILNILQQSSGVIVMLFFVTTIFEQTGSNLESHVSTIIIGVTQVVVGPAGPFFVDRTGRKSLLLISTILCTLSLTALGTYFYLYNTNHPAADSLSWIALTSLILFFMAYNIGFGIIPQTLLGEMFTANVRSFGSTFTITVGWIFGFGVSTAFGYMWPAWGAAVTIWIYAGACAIAFLFSAVFVPETKGKSLLEIQEMLSK